MCVCVFMCCASVCFHVSVSVYMRGCKQDPYVHAHTYARKNTNSHTRRLHTQNMRTRTHANTQTHTHTRTCARARTHTHTHSPPQDKWRNLEKLGKRNATGAHLPASSSAVGLAQLQPSVEFGLAAAPRHDGSAPAAVGGMEFPVGGMKFPLQSPPVTTLPTVA